MTLLLTFIQKAIGQGVAILFGASGEIVTEKSGNLNLGIPGIMYMGGIAGLMGAFFYEKSTETPNGAIGVLVSLLCSLIASALGGLIYSFLTITLRANQNVVGLALTTFGVGFGNFFGGSISKLAGGVGQISVQTTAAAYRATIPGLSKIPVIGTLFFSYGFLTYLSVIVAVAMKMPAIPGITLGIISGAIMGMIFQPECNMGTVFDFGMNGYYFSDEVLAMFEETLSPETSYTMTRLLESGGILGMMSSVAMTIIAMMFGGIMEDTHQLEVIVNSLKKLAKGPAGLVLLTECTCVLSNAVMPEQYISIVVPGRMYAEEYREKGLHPALLSGTLESAGTVTSALIPWNTCGVFISSTLDINAWGAGGYGPWALFNWLMPLINWLCALIGWTVKDLAGKPYKKSKAAAKAE